jgi:mannose-6-phosphate isomerase-like protein (cupin superfamily)
MLGYVSNIEEISLQNSNFRQVLFTATNCQLVAMSLLPNEEIGMEVHPTVDQFFRIEAGEGKIVMDGVETPVKDGSAIIVPMGTQHNLINTLADKPMKLYTIYCPPQHKEGTVHATKADAMADETDHR